MRASIRKKSFPQQGERGKNNMKMIIKQNCGIRQYIT